MRSDLSGIVGIVDANDLQLTCGHIFVAQDNQAQLPQTRIDLVEIDIALVVANHVVNRYVKFTQGTQLIDGNVREVDEIACDHHIIGLERIGFFDNAPQQSGKPRTDVHIGDLHHPQAIAQFRETELNGLGADALGVEAADERA